MLVPANTTINRVRCVVGALARLQTELPNQRRCIAFAAGGQTKKVLSDLKALEGVYVAWTGSVLPIWGRLILGWMPNQAAVVQIQDARRLEHVFMTLIESSLTGVFLISPTLEAGLIERASARASLGEIEEFDRASATSSFLFAW